MNLSKLKPDMIVYDVGTYKMGNTSLRSIGVWHVRILSVDITAGTVEASWNNNPARKYNRSSWSKWRLKKPMLVRDAFGRNRLQTREEKKKNLV